MRWPPGERTGRHRRRPGAIGPPASPWRPPGIPGSAAGAGGRQPDRSLPGSREAPPRRARAVGRITIGHHGNLLGASPQVREYSRMVRTATRIVGVADDSFRGVPVAGSTHRTKDCAVQATSGKRRSSVAYLLDFKSRNREKAAALLQRSTLVPPLGVVAIFLCVRGPRRPAIAPAGAAVEGGVA